jgi:16S rRNA (adenine1518-N6/adenine1519-N6)-dimethyltransferase
VSKRYALSIPSVQTLLRKYGIVPKKALGQHFLSEIPTIRKIVRYIEPSEKDLIIEIGPGLGFMTRLLAERAETVLAVERDSRLLEIARDEHGDIGNIVWIQGDILKLTIERIISSCPKPKQGHNIKVAGNLPYNISTPILFWILSNRKKISRATIMLQKEVALRITAKPGNKDYGILAVRVQAVAKATKLFDISPTNFIPQPAVTSSVVDIDFATGDKMRPTEEAVFSDLVKAAFGKRRKTLRNSLLGSTILGLSVSEIDSLLERASIDGRRRPETLTVSEFVKLAAIIKN